MRRPIFLLPLIAALALASPAAAQAPLDPRIRELTYDPAAVYRIAGAFRTATQIVFSPEETIRHAAIGDSVAWEVAAEGSVLFLKPRERHQATNLLVVTEREGAVRHYAFELLAREAGDRTAIAYQVRFRYPADEQAQAARALAVQAEAVEQRLIGLELERGSSRGPAIWPGPPRATPPCSRARSATMAASPCCVSPASRRYRPCSRSERTDLSA